MQKEGPFFVDVCVPEAVLLPRVAEPEPLVHPNVCGAVWYRADEGSLSINDAGIVKCWHPAEGLGDIAVPVKPNVDNLRLSADGGLLFEKEVNSGLVVNNALVDPEQFSFAIRYSSDYGEARTLLTINPTDHDTYLFLSEKDGHVMLSEQKDRVAISLPAPKGGGWVVGGYERGAVSLAVCADGEDLCRPVMSNDHAAELSQDFSAASDVFIGCRSHRNGILKTLGNSRIHDLMIWIDQDLCSGDVKALNAACRYCEDKDKAE